MQYSLIPACGIFVTLIITINTKKKTPGAESEKCGGGFIDSKFICNLF